MEGFEEDLKELIPMFYGDEGPQGLESEGGREKRHLMEMEEVLDRNYESFFFLF